jgi:hypothetical protein
MPATTATLSPPPSLWDKVFSLLRPTSDADLREAMLERRSRGEEVPEEVQLLLLNASIEPNTLVRRKDIGKLLGLKSTSIDHLVASGELKTFAITPNGTATAALGSSILAFQLRSLLRSLIDTGERRTRQQAQAAIMRAGRAKRAARR